MALICNFAIMQNILSTAVPSVGPFSTAVQSGDLLFFSGQIGVDNKGQLADGFEGEVNQALGNIRSILAEQHLDFSHIVSITIYLDSMKNYKTLNEIYRTWFTDHFPARTCIAVAELPLHAQIELTVTASLKK